MKFFGNFLDFLEVSKNLGVLKKFESFEEKKREVLKKIPHFGKKFGIFEKKKEKHTSSKIDSIIVLPFYP